MSALAIAAGASLVAPATAHPAPARPAPERVVPVAYTAAVLALTLARPEAACA